MDPKPLAPPIMTDPGTPSAETPPHAGWESFDVAICKSGWTVDERGYAPQFMAQLADNTNYMIEKAGLKPVVRFDHPGECDLSTGEAPSGGGILTRFWTEPDATSPDNLVLFATMALWGTALEAHKNGAVPQRSIGFPSRGMTPAGMLVGWYVNHLALLPLEGAAFPGLDQASELAADAAESGQGRNFLARGVKAVMAKMNEVLTAFGRVTLAAQTATEDDGMDPLDPEQCAEYGTELLAARDAMANVTAILGKVGAYLTGASPTDGPAKEVPPDDEAEAKLAAKGERDKLAARVQADALAARDDAFADLVKGGHITAQHRTAFMASAASDGLAAAKAAFGALHVERPPSSDRQGDQPTGLEADYNEYLSFNAKRGLKIIPKDDWMQLMARSAHRAQAAGVN